MISESRGTNIREHEPPKMASPTADKDIVSGKLNTFDGPNMKSAIDAKMKAMKVNQCLGITEVRQPTKGEDMA
jgi:hypothetical protein